MNDCLQSPQQVREMFARIAQRYDLLNHFLSFGQDRHWRKKLVHSALAFNPSVIVDVATGTGDVLLELQSRNAPDCQLIGLDFCEPMLRLAQAKNARHLVIAPAAPLPFASKTIDVMTVAFGIRNFPNRSFYFQEAARVLKTAGRLLILEFTQPPRWISPLYFFYLKHFAPLLAKIIGAEKSAYQYLGDSIRQFPNQEQLAVELKQAGFQRVTWRLFSFRTVALHQAELASPE